jgi:hypothetical protein
MKVNQSMWANPILNGEAAVDRAREMGVRPDEGRTSCIDNVADLLEHATDR